MSHIKLIGGAQIALVVAALVWAGSCLAAQDQPIPVQGSGHVAGRIAGCTPPRPSHDTATVGPTTVHWSESGAVLGATTGPPPGNVNPAPEKDTHLIGPYESGGLPISRWIVRRDTESERDFRKRVKDTVLWYAETFPVDQ